MVALENYIPRKYKYIEAKNKLLNNVKKKKKITRGEKKLLKDLKTKYFHLIMMKSMRNE